MLCLLALVGCGGDANAPVEITGEVVWDNKPLATGTVTLVPQETGSATSGAIENGAFTIPRERGPVPGMYRVEIEAYLPTGRQIPDPDQPGKKGEETRQVIPPKYNRATELTAEVTRGGENHFEFTLERK